MLAIQGGARLIPRGTVQPWPHITDEDRRAVMAALDTASPWRWPFETVTELESAWSELTGARHVLACNSGTAALHMAVAAAGIGPGDEVLVPADTFLSSATCVLQANAVPVFVDVDPVTYNVDPEAVAAAVTDRTAAIIAVDLHGLPADYERLRAVARPRGLAVIEDGAQAHGATYRGRQVGALGDVSACSLNGSKCLSALGEGGLLSTDDERIRHLAERVRMFGEDVVPGARREYAARMMGWNYRLDPLQAAFARSQLRRLPEMSAWREANGRRLTAALSGVPGVRTPAVPEDRAHVFFFYPLMVRPEDFGLPAEAVERFRRVLKACLRAEGLKIDEWQPWPLPAQPLFQELIGYGRGCPWTCGHARPGVTYRAEDFPVAVDVCRRRLVMGHSFSSFGPPNGPELMDRYAEAFHKVLVEHRSEFLRLVEAAAE